MSYAINDALHSFTLIRNRSIPKVNLLQFYTHTMHMNST